MKLSNRKETVVKLHQTGIEFLILCPSFTKIVPITSQRLQDAEIRRVAKERRGATQVQSPPKPSDNSSTEATRNKISIFDGSMNPEEVQSEGTAAAGSCHSKEEGTRRYSEDLNEPHASLWVWTHSLHREGSNLWRLYHPGVATSKVREELIEALDAKLPVDWSAQGFHTTGMSRALSMIFL
jgi:hypothetical protein